MNYDLNVLKNNMLELKTRKFGKSIEIIVNSLFGLSEFGSAYFNSLDDDKIRYEICGTVARPLVKQKLLKSNFLDYLSNRNNANAVSLENNDLFHSNFNQLKVDYFDILIYVICFDDYVLFFKINKDILINQPFIHSKQHKNSVNEYQFSVDNKNLGYHIDNYLKFKLTYEQIFKMFMEELTYETFCISSI